MNKEILLQGFHWDSIQVKNNDLTPGWYRIIRENASRIRNAGFTLVWFPPPADSVESHGYEPRRLNILDSDYGSEDELKESIAALSSVRAIADIVINHRSGTSGPGDFTEPSWPSSTIVIGDENSGQGSMNTDSGEHAPFSRDLDHRNAIVSNGISEWMNSLKTRVGFVGWRYDFVKGYAGWATELYNGKTFPEFSVGEFFDYDVDAVIDWIDSTHPDPAFRSTAFDFPLRNALYQAVAWKKFHWLKYIDKPPGVIGLWSDKAVTFLENHDTEEARGGQYSPPFPGGDQMIQGYAYLLTHPGIPCLYWRDIFDSGDSVENSITNLIQIRKMYGIHSESRLFIAKAEQENVYAAYIQGDNGELAMKMGPGPWQPFGDKWNNPVEQLLFSGADFAIWGDRGRF